MPSGDGNFLVGRLPKRLGIELHIQCSRAWPFAVQWGCVFITTGCDRGSDHIACAIFWLCLLSCRRESIGNILGRVCGGVIVRGDFEENAVLSAPNVILMLFFRFHPRKCLIISRYIAIYWIFLRIFARIFRSRCIPSYLAVNEPPRGGEWTGEGRSKGWRKQNKQILT